MVLSRRSRQGRCADWLGVVALLAGASASAAEPDAGAWHPGSRFVMHSLTVIGQGRATAKPDLAVAAIGVEVIGKSLEEANELSNGRMDALIKTLKETASRIGTSRR